MLRGLEALGAGEEAEGTVPFPPGYLPCPLLCSRKLPKPCFLPRSLLKWKGKSVLRAGPGLPFLPSGLQGPSIPQPHPQP